MAILYLFFALFAIVSVALNNSLLKREYFVFPSPNIATQIFTDSMNNGLSKGFISQTESAMVVDCEVVKTSWTHGFCGIKLIFSKPLINNGFKKYEDLEIVASLDTKLKDTTFIYLINKEENEGLGVSERANMVAVVLSDSLTKLSIPIDSFYVPSWWVNSNAQDPYYGKPRLNNISSIQIVTGDNTEARKEIFTIHEIKLTGTWVNTELLYLFLLSVSILMSTTHALHTVLRLRQSSKDNKQRAIELEQILNVIKVEKDKFETLAKYDALTGLLNRVGIRHAIQASIEKFRSHRACSSLIIFDIDNFKQLNDTYGHNIGDAVLAELSSTVVSQIRESDYLARWGGEEFIVVCAETNIHAAYSLAEKLRQHIEKNKVAGHNITCSFGVSELKESDIKKWFDEADKALYQAKRSGRNKVSQT